MTKFNSLARARVIGPEGGAWGGGASGNAREGAAGVDVLVVSSSLLMLFFCLGKDQNIINKDHHGDIQIVHENLVHQVHEESWGISQAERHDRVLIQLVLVGECRLWYILGTDP